MMFICYQYAVNQKQEFLDLHFCLKGSVFVFLGVKTACRNT